MALVETRKGSAMAEEGILHDGIYRVGDVRVSDLAGRKRLPIGDSVFESVVGNKVYIDKSMLIADVLDSGAVATLFCRSFRQVAQPEHAPALPGDPQPERHRLGACGAALPGP